MQHAKKEYQPKAMGQSGTPHYPVDPPRTGSADSSYDSTVRESDPGYRGMGNEPNMTTQDNEMFTDE